MSHQAFPENPEALRAENDRLRAENHALRLRWEELEARQAQTRDAVQAMAETERALQDEPARRTMRLLLENSPDILLLFDAVGRLTHATRTFLRTVGIPDVSVLAGLPFSQVFSKFAPQDWVRRIADRFADALADKQSLELTEEIALAQGQPPHIYQVHFTPMLRADGVAEGAMVLFLDITEPERARAQAEAANASKSLFLSTMSHEMRTPLNAILGMGRIAQDSTDIQRLHYCVEQINIAGNHLLVVLSDVLDMSRIENGKLELNEAPFSVEDMLQKVAHVLAFRAEEKRQRLSLLLAPEVPRALMADEQRLRQVLVNLLSNAIKFTPEEGEISLAVRLLSLSGGLCTLEFAVQDSGIGISKEELQRLFQPFHQADDGFARHHGGTGLGLVIAQRIVRLMQGEIQVDSNPGRGSRFSFSIRVRLAPERPDSLHTLPVDWPQVRILVIGDDAKPLAAFPRLAGQVGFHCDLAHDTHTAQARMAEAGDAYRLVFLDFQTAGVDMLSLLAQVRKACPDAQCIAISATLDWIEMERQARDAGICWVVFKPYGAADITDAIANVLGGRPEGGTGGDAPSAATPQELAARKDAFAGKRMLLAEDVAMNREIMLMLLEGSGMAIESAENGKEALDRYVERPEAFDILFMDIHMPEMDGYEATRRIRAFEEGAGLHVPIVAVTANAFREDIEKCLEAGMDDHVSKPVRLEELLEKLHKYLG